MSDELEEVQKLVDSLDTDDVGQKRYLMYRIFDQLLEKTYELNDHELPETEERVAKLNGLDGYMYKLAQEFLTSSSTLKKQQKLEKMVEHVERSSK